MALKGKYELQKPIRVIFKFFDYCKLQNYCIKQKIQKRRKYNMEKATQALNNSFGSQPNPVMSSQPAEQLTLNSYVKNQSKQLKKSIKSGEIHQEMMRYNPTARDLKLAKYHLLNAIALELGYHLISAAEYKRRKREKANSTKMPSRYKKDFYALWNFGCSDTTMAKIFRVSPQTIKRWKVAEAEARTQTQVLLSPLEDKFV